MDCAGGTETAGALTYNHELEWGKPRVGHDDIDNSTPIDLGLKPITVGIEALEDLEKFLTEELAFNMAPKSQEIIMDHKTGEAVLGPAASSVLMTVKGEYEVSAQAAITALGSYVDATRTLIGAIHNVTELYRHADGMVNAQTKEVLQAFDDSWAQIQAGDKQRAEQQLAAWQAKMDRIDKVVGGA